MGIDQAGAPKEAWYRFNGRQLGYTGNNGTNDMSMAASIEDRQVTIQPDQQGTFRNNKKSGISYADFAQSYDPINSFSQGSAGGSYTVQQGDTLQSIAQGLYGDSALWYKIAEINGLGTASGLIEGQTLTLPTGVIKSRHNAGTLKPYNPADTLGDLTPDASPKPKKKKCGVLGAVLIAVIAVAVAALAGPAIVGAVQGVLVGSAAAGTAAAATGMTAGAIIGGAITGAVSSVVSQAVGVATKIQDKFSWKAVGMAALGGAVSAGIGPDGLFGSDGMFSSVKSGMVQAGLRASAGNAITQGIGRVTGLQSSFSWAGVAAAGAGAAVGYEAFKRFGAQPLNDEAGANGEVTKGSRSFSNYMTHSGVSAVSLIASAATRSALEGTSFADGIRSAIPDIIAQTIGNVLQNGIGEVSKTEDQVKNRPTDQTNNRYRPQFPSDYRRVQFNGDQGWYEYGEKAIGALREGYNENIVPFAKSIFNRTKNAVEAQIHIITVIGNKGESLLKDGVDRVVDIAMLAAAQNPVTLTVSGAAGAVRQAGYRKQADQIYAAGQVPVGGAQFVGDTLGSVLQLNISTVFSPIDTSQSMFNLGQQAGNYLSTTPRQQILADAFNGGRDYANRLSNNAAGLARGDAAAGRAFGYQLAEIASVALPSAKGAQVVGSAARTARAAEKIAMNSGGDRLIGSMGSARINNAAELDVIISDLTSQGVEISFRKGQFAYGPAPSGGRAGNIIFDPDGSISAIRHEYGHFIDDRALGFPGQRFYFKNPNARVATERSQYLGEIRTARQLGDHGARKALIQDYLSERNYLIENFYTKPYGVR